jgi:phenylacetate-CoA ligase
VLPDGESGELVFTSLTKEALPVIRYRTRDITNCCLERRARCDGWDGSRGARTTCSSSAGVNVFPTQVEELILADRRLAPHYVLEVRRDGRLDTLTVVVEPASTSQDRTATESATEQLGRRIKDRIGVTSDVRIAEVGGVARSIGKAKRVIDLR